MNQRDAEATKARILAAAVAEFADYGFAGGRVDRIATGAQANKSLIYSYFGNKAQLFEAVIDAAVGDLHESVAFSADDLPGYGGRLFDFLVAHPVELRIDAWRRLELPGHTPLEEEIFATKIAQIDALGPDAGYRVDSADLLVAVLAQAWSRVTVPSALETLTNDTIAQRRTRVVESIEALCEAAR